MDDVDKNVLDERSPVLVTGRASNTIKSIAVAPSDFQVVSELLHLRSLVRYDSESRQYVSSLTQ